MERDLSFYLVLNKQNGLFQIYIFSTLNAPIWPKKKKDRVLKINLEESTQINSYLVNRSYTLPFLFFVYICDISGPEERL